MEPNYVAQILKSNQGAAITFNHITDGASAVGVVSVNPETKTFKYISGQDLATMTANPKLAQQIWGDLNRHRTMSFSEILIFN